jgi:hypothetical protein
MELHADFGERTINELILIFRDRQMNLEPGFQRRSVWTLTDRQRLIQSIMSNYPVPCIFLYRRSNRGKLIYDVIDGKQRLETIFMFTGVGRFKRDIFSAKMDLGDNLQFHDWFNIRRHYKSYRHIFDSYKIQMVEVTGNLGDIIDLFVRINSTGKRLTSGEKRHARFYLSPFLKEAERLVLRSQHYLLSQRILTKAQIDRMKGTELFAELLMSIHSGGPINKKVSLDRAIGNEGINGNTLNRLSNEFIRTLNLMKYMFPELKQTRFKNTAEYYTLFMLIWEMNSAGLILKDRKRNRIANSIMKKLSLGVDELREQLRKVRPAKPAQRLYSDYLLTVIGDTDSLANRERRREIIKGLLYTIYERKDEKRTFTAEQRRIIWNNEEKHKCGHCKKILVWDDFTIDHIVAHMRGGKTKLENAQLLCRSCNSRKGGK